MIGDDMFVLVAFGSPGTGSDYRGGCITENYGCNIFSNEFGISSGEECSFMELIQNRYNLIFTSVIGGEFAYDGDRVWRSEKTPGESDKTRHGRRRPCSNEN